MKGKSVIDKTEGMTESGIHFRVTRSPQSKDPLLLIMGYGANLGMWPLRFVDKLAEYYVVITFDNRGVGQSVKNTLPGEYSTGLMAGDADAVIRKLDLSRIHLLGYSLGGCIALEYAHLYPSKVKTLFLMSTTAGGALRVKARQPISATLCNPPGESLWDMYMSVWKLCMSEQAINRHMDELKDLFEQSRRYLTPPESLQGHLKALELFDSSQYLKRLMIPATVLVGLDDRILPPENSQKLAAALTHAKLVEIPGCEHYAHVEFQDRVLKEIICLCNSDLP